MRFVVLLILGLLVLPRLACAADSSTVMITQSGAACDGKTDDSAAIKRLLDNLKGGGLVAVPPGKTCLIAGANLVVPSHTRIIGSGYPFRARGRLVNVSGFLLGPGRTIQMSGGTALENLLIRTANLNPDPTPPEVIAAVRRWCSERSVGVTIPPNVDGVRLSSLFIEGFNTAVLAEAGQYTISHVAGDDCNGIDQDGGGDNSYVDDVRFEPFYALRTPANSGSWDRPGIAFYFHDGGTGWYCTRCFSFMWQNGIVISDEGVGTVADSGFEWQWSFGNGASGTVGLRWIGHNAETSAHNVYSSGFDTSVSDEGTGEVIMGAISPSPNTHQGTTGFYLGGRSAASPKLEIAGKATQGGAISVAFTQPRPVTVTYQFTQGETPEDIAAGLKNLLVHDQTLIAAHISAHLSRNTVALEWPGAEQVNFHTSATGSVVLKTTTGTPVPGSYGMITETDSINGQQQIPIFTFAPNTFRWTVNGLFASNGSLPRHWLKVEMPNNQLTLSAIPWSQLNAGNLSDCGNGQRTDPHATDHAGLVTEGAGSAGCVIRFTTPYPIPPHCVVSSQTGTPLSYAVDAAEIRVGNARAPHTEISYVCSLEF
jgi:hypothetical protein